ncbi:hypothetical protein [Enterovirga aerilata]|uniref:Large exoprotein involved in heme utilization or adhesion n=1 Tax=Enterovirga aerilata TaxID=2730920 RepID=A0A849I5Y4_9HYPH|nr:hypothetical protein [Enterovirga sp. DB1703]NNM71510.1 hypothetical protein [Enterovirga sp. DB1703]
MRLAVTLALAIGAAAISGAAQAQKGDNRFDGQWSVEVITRQGNCDRAYRYPIVVQNGAIRYGGTEAFSASGSVSQSGAVKGTISRGEQRAQVTGRVSGASGSGTWQTTTGCSGVWNAEKRG